jgi:two-component system response regulator LytT
MGANGGIKMIKAFVVDDEPLARDELAYLLRRTKQVEIVGEAESIDDAIGKIFEVEVDVLFLDIQLAGESGLDLASKILQQKHRPEIVFATAFDEYALKAFDLHAIDYLLKPFDETRVQTTIQKLAKILRTKKNVNGAKISNRTEGNDRLAITVDERILEQLMEKQSLLRKKINIKSVNHSLALNESFNHIKSYVFIELF